MLCSHLIAGGDHQGDHARTVSGVRFKCVCERERRGRGSGGGMDNSDVSFNICSFGDLSGYKNVDHLFDFAYNHAR